MGRPYIAACFSRAKGWSVGKKLGISLCAFFVLALTVRESLQDLPLQTASQSFAINSIFGIGGGGGGKHTPAVHADQSLEDVLLSLGSAPKGSQLWRTARGRHEQDAIEHTAVSFPKVTVAAGLGVAAQISCASSI